VLPDTPYGNIPGGVIVGPTNPGELMVNPSWVESMYKIFPFTSTNCCIGLRGVIGTPYPQLYGVLACHDPRNACVLGTKLILKGTLCADACGLYRIVSRLNTGFGAPLLFDVELLMSILHASSNHPISVSWVQ
jgi:hypothetical protein